MIKLKGPWLPSNKPEEVRFEDKKELINVLSLLAPKKIICYEVNCTEDDPTKLTIVDRFTFCHTHEIEYQKAKK